MNHKKVLIVDDSETARLQIGKALEQAGFAVLEAADGFEGLERVSETPEVSMVILDVNMPRMNGLEMLEAAPKLTAIGCFCIGTNQVDLPEAAKRGKGAQLLSPATGPPVLAITALSDAELDQVIDDLVPDASDPAGTPTEKVTIEKMELQSG